MPECQKQTVAVPVTARQSAREELKTVDSSWPESTSQASRRFSQGWKGGVGDDGDYGLGIYTPVSPIFQRLGVIGYEN